MVILSYGIVLKPSDYIGEQLFGAHEVTRVLHQGGTTTLLEATHESSSRERIAVKLLGPEAARDTTAYARASMEAVLVSSLEHPHIAELLGFGELDDQPYVALELLQGEGLDTRLARESRLAPREVARIVGQAGGALAAAHAQGIVHGALKPRYLFLQQADRAHEPPMVKLLGFGIARVSDPLLPGPGSFLSPEQLEPGQQPDPSTDIFALGSIAYLALGGQLSGAEPPLLHELEPGLPPELDAVVRRAMAPDPQQRQEDMGALVEALEQAARLAPPDAQPFADHPTTLLEEPPGGETSPIADSEGRAAARPVNITGPMPAVIPDAAAGVVLRPTHPTGPMPAVIPNAAAGVLRPTHPTGPMPAVTPETSPDAPARAPTGPVLPLSPEADAIQPRRTALAPAQLQLQSNSERIPHATPAHQAVLPADEDEQPTDFISLEQLHEEPLQEAATADGGLEEATTVETLSRVTTREEHPADPADFKKTTVQAPRPAPDAAPFKETAIRAEADAAPFKETAILAEADGGTDFKETAILAEAGGDTDFKETAVLAEAGGETDFKKTTVQAPQEPTTADGADARFKGTLLERVDTEQDPADFKQTTVQAGRRPVSAAFEDAATMEFAEDEPPEE